MQFFNLLIALFTFFTAALAVPTDMIQGRSSPAPPPVVPGTYCRQNNNFVLSPQCYFGTHFDPYTRTAGLYLYNYACDEIGYYPDAPVGQVFDFDSELPYVVVVTSLEMYAAPEFLYSDDGKLGGDGAECWFDSEGWYACAQLFDC